MNYTHYDYLELAPGASSARVETAYLQLIERFQYGSSDTGQDLSGLVRMIHTAYDVLSNPATRRAYDAELAHEAQVADDELKSVLDTQAVRSPRRVQDVPEPMNAVFGQLAA